MADFEMNPPWDTESVTNVTIGGSVTSIGDCAFYNCSSLSSLDIPGSVTSIGYSAFAGSGLETLRLADGVASIGRTAFTNCSALRSVVIPSSVVSIGDQAFTGCPRLSITVDEGSEHFVTDGMGALYDLGMTRLLWFPQSGTSTIDSKYVIPTTVTKIAAGAFHDCRGVVYMALPGTVETIGDMAFFNSGLVTLKLADGVKSIGKNAFAGCPLSYLVMADTVETFQFGAFHGCNFKDAAGKEFSDPDYDAIKGRKYVADTDGTLVEYMPKVGGRSSWTA